MYLQAAMLAEHVSSELRMHLWPLRSQTDRNTPSQMKIYLGQYGYNGFLIITDITDFSSFYAYRFSTCLRTKKIEMLSRLGVQFLAA